jgi:hypothetical protein
MAKEQDKMKKDLIGTFFLFSIPLSYLCFSPSLLSILQLAVGIRLTKKE